MGVSAKRIAVSLHSVYLIILGSYFRALEAHSNPFLADKTYGIPPEGEHNPLQGCHKLD